MLRYFALLLISLTFEFSLFGQSKIETVEFIIREMKSFGNDAQEIKEIEFSDNGSLCKIKTAVPGQMNEKTLEISLSEVDIFACTKIVKMGTDEYVYLYSLLASSRGRNGQIRKNLSKRSGTEIILQNTLNGQKIKGLESAFAHLTELVTGQKKTFKPTIDLQ